jgi:hypothetical protein
LGCITNFGNGALVTDSAHASAIAA